MIERVETFRVQLPLIRVFANPGMKDRHWEEVTLLIGFGVKSDKDLYLSKFFEFDQTHNFARLEEISDSATKEYNLERILNKMKEDWEPVITELKPWKDTGTFIVSGASNDEV